MEPGVYAGQLWRLQMKANGDLIALPSKAQSAIHIGRVTGDYHYEKKDNNVIHWRLVK